MGAIVVLVMRGRRQASWLRPICILVAFSLLIILVLIPDNINITDTTTIITTAAGLEEKIKASVLFQV